MSTSRINLRRRRNQAIIIVTILVVVSIGSYILVPTFQRLVNYNVGWGITQISLAGGLAVKYPSVVLSGLLVIAYIAQTATLKRQKTILGNQQSLMEADHQPVLNVDDIRGNDDEIILGLTNVGNGVATDIAVQMLAEPVDDQGNIGTIVQLGKWETTHPLSRRGSSPGSNNLQAGDNDEFAAEIYIPSPDDDQINELFAQVMEKLDRRGAEKIAFQVVLVYDHMMESKGHAWKYLDHQQAEIDGRTTVEEVLDDPEWMIISSSALRSRETTFEETRTKFNNLPGDSWWTRLPLVRSVHDSVSG